jgi:ribosome-associated protein
MDDLPPETTTPQRDKFTLEQFLKREGWTGTGGQAKYVIQEGMVRLNGAVETRRRKQLALGDVIEFETFRATVTEL